MAAEAPHRAEPTKWPIRARTSHDAHGVAASNWPGPTLASTARVLAKALLSCRVGRESRSLFIVGDPLSRYAPNQASPPAVAEGPWPQQVDLAASGKESPSRPRSGALSRGRS